MKLILCFPFSSLILMHLSYNNWMSFNTWIPQSTCLFRLIEGHSYNMLLATMLFFLIIYFNSHLFTAGLSECDGAHLFLKYFINILFCFGFLTFNCFDLKKNFISSFLLKSVLEIIFRTINYDSWLTIILNY